MQPEKKQLEILLMHYFRECYPGFPRGKLMPFESPDFIVTLKSRNHLGIELTRLNPLNASDPDEKEKDKNDIQEHVIDLAQSLFEHDSSRKVFIKFLFSRDSSHLKHRELSTALQIVSIIRQVVYDKAPGASYRELIPSDKLPDGLEYLLIVQNPVLKVSFWERSNNLGISNNVVEDLREAVRKKDEKLRLYQKQRLNYYWLLITTDRLRGVKNYNLSERIMNHSFMSRFQHVFLFDLIMSKVYQLV